MGSPLLNADGKKPPGGLACGSFGLCRGSVLNPFELTATRPLWLQVVAAVRQGEVERGVFNRPGTAFLMTDEGVEAIRANLRIVTLLVDDTLLPKSDLPTSARVASVTNHGELGAVEETPERLSGC